MMTLDAGIHRIADGAQVERIIATLAASNWQVFRLPEGICTVDGFFDAMRLTLPLDPPVISSHWDALADSLWSGLEALPEKCVLVLWPLADQMMRLDSGGFSIATSVLRDVCESLSSVSPPVGTQKTVAIIQTTGEK